MRLGELRLLSSRSDLERIPERKVLINTVNAWSFVVAQEDPLFAAALREGDYLIPDGISIVKAARFLRLEQAPIERVAGWDLFCFEMDRLEARGGVCLFLGSSPSVLEAIRTRAAVDYPHIRVETFSPPYKAEFSEEDSREMLDVIRQTDPDLLWIGMTAPKQEKWTYEHWSEMDLHCPCGTVGAVFDFFAGTARRAPGKWQRAGLEWLYRLLHEPKRMARRYLVGNPKFLWLILKEKMTQ